MIFFNPINNNHHQCYRKNMLVQALLIGWAYSKVLQLVYFTVNSKYTHKLPTCHQFDAYITEKSFYSSPPHFSPLQSTKLKCHPICCFLNASNKIVYRPVKPPFQNKVESYVQLCIFQVATLQKLKTVWHRLISLLVPRLHYNNQLFPLGRVE